MALSIMVKLYFSPIQLLSDTKTFFFVLTGVPSQLQIQSTLLPIGIAQDGILLQVILKC